jgi:hypothetical protein
MTMLTKIATAAALTLGIGAASLAPTAAQAQSFGFSFGNDNGRFGFHIGDDDDYRYRPRCIPTRQLDNAIERQGYRNVRIRDIDRRTTEATGVRGGWRYALVVNTCNGRIIDRDRLRRV